MANPMLRPLLLAILLVFAQGVMAWHAPSHILEHPDRGAVLASHNCDLCVHGHGLVGLTSAPSNLVIPPAAHPIMPPRTSAVAITFPLAHPARAPPRLL